MKFHVIRPHLGDKMYLPGDTREAKEGDVKHLVDNGVLSTDEPKSKALGKLANKAETGAPKNKAE
ncbi:hypothetical protein [Mesorhizobium sp. RMAD-H1]|uniref:hypothetical protein n=1 Tax=Mesorhizobium sp. RMAD-H1 TaxID=2587065 RepID=UPI00161C5B21|nr:hypothetical protein [Mesorhizobium sp. RMAD-H1]MBB2973953.1 hypothetical protein [Mesorhizobium sp. RMAD-H1]